MFGDILNPPCQREEVFVVNSVIGWFTSLGTNSALLVDSALLVSIIASVFIRCESSSDGPTIKLVSVDSFLIDRICSKLNFGRSGHSVYDFGTKQASEIKESTIFKCPYGYRGIWYTIQHDSNKTFTLSGNNFTKTQMNQNTIVMISYGTSVVKFQTISNNDCDILYNFRESVNDFESENIVNNTDYAKTYSVFHHQNNTGEFEFKRSVFIMNVFRRLFTGIGEHTFTECAFFGNSFDSEVSSVEPILPSTNANLHITIQACAWYNFTMPFSKQVF